MWRRTDGDWNDSRNAGLTLLPTFKCKLSVFSTIPLCSLYAAACFHQLTPSYLPCRHNHLSNWPGSSPFGTSPLAVSHLVEAPRCRWRAGLHQILNLPRLGAIIPLANHARFVTPLGKNARSSLIVVGNADLKGVIVEPGGQGTGTATIFLLEDLKQGVTICQTSGLFITLCESPIASFRYWIRRRRASLILSLGGGNEQTLQLQSKPNASFRWVCRESEEPPLS